MIPELGRSSLYDPVRAAIHDHRLDRGRVDAYRAGYDFKRLFTISEFYDRDRATFYQAIQSVRDNAMDLTGWIEFFTHGLATQLGEVKARGETVIRADVLARAQKLNERQYRLFAVLMLNDAATIRSLQDAMPDVPRRTLQRDLSILESRGLIRSSGQTNRTMYRVNQGAV